MNSDSESFHHQLLTWVLADNATTFESSLGDGEDIYGVENPLKQAAAKSGEPESGGSPQTFQLGEIPTVQERFQAVIKRRLQIQIQNHPPLFPWETQLIDYPDYADEESIGLVPAWGWVAQQSKLNLPIALPESIFRQLLHKCQVLLTSSIPLGAKLVQAVEELFPNDSQTLNDIAGLVLRSTYRSVEALESMPDIQKDYSNLEQSQQIALSLLTVKQLLDNLTLPISLTHPVVEREWLTSAGVIKLKAEYQSPGQKGRLRVQGEIPTQGIVILKGNGTQAVAKSSSSGNLSLELPCGELNQTYTLEVDFPQMDQQPLLFVITPTT